MPRDLRTNLLLHPTFFKDLGQEPTPDRHPEASLFGMTRDRVMYYLQARTEYADPKKANAWFAGSGLSENHPRWGPCDRWVGSFRDGQPLANLSTGTYPVHRIVWELERGPSVEGFVARPRCGHDLSCVKPLHLGLYRAREAMGKLTLREIADLVSLCMRRIRDDPEHREHRVYKNHAAIFGVTPETVRHHVIKSHAYLDWRVEEELIRFSQERR
jgi:hypothetical protein